MRPTSSIAIHAAPQHGMRATVLWRLAAVGMMSALGAVAPAAAGVDDQEAAAVRAIPASVSTVVDGGIWGESGSYRVVVTQGGFEHIHSRVYAQWLSTNDEGDAKVEESVRVKVLSNLAFDVVGDARIALASQKSKGVFEVDLVNRDTQKKRIALLLMGKPGELSVEMPPTELAK